MRRLRILILVAVVALMIPASAFGWFFRGWLPLVDGTRAVHEWTCCTNPVHLRQSWEVDTHDMNMLKIQWSGSWVSYRVSGPPWDHTWNIDLWEWRKAGCQNPLGMYTVWVNCDVYD